MDINHGYGSGDVGKAGEAPTVPARPKPKLFSMAQSHALLESKRLNTSHLSEQQNVLNTRIRMDSAQPQRKTALQAPARISLSHLSNTNPARTSTPVSAPRLNASLYNTERLESNMENVNSSPAFTSFESPDRAYIQPKRPFSVAPDPQRTFRLSALYHRPETPRQQANDTTAQPGSMGSVGKSQGNVKERDNMFQYFNSTLSENEQLRAENRHLESTNAQLSRNMDDYRSNLNVLNEQLSSATSEVKNLRPALASARERLAVNESEIATLKASLTNTKSELDTALAEHNSLKEEHAQETLENDRLRASVETAKKGIAKLLIEYATLGEHLRELKKGHDSQKSLYSAVVKEFEQTKTLAKSGLQALEPMLDDSNTMARAQDTKIILKELHDDLVASQQVTDLLRNKLHHQSSQLADAQSRVSELEEEKRGSLKELLAARQEAKREYKLLMAVEAQIGELSARLSERERESMDALTTAAIGEVELKAAKEQIDRYQKESETQGLELCSLRKVKEENVSSLLALQDVINTRDKEIISLKADVKALNESKSELRALLAENKKNLAEAETELRTKETTISTCARDVVSLNADRKALMESKAELQTLLSEAKERLADKVAELKLRNPNEDLLIKIRELETTCGSLKAALEESQEQCILRERSLTKLESQLTKKLHDAERANVELTSFNTALRESSASVQDQLRTVQAELKEALNTASVAMEKCSALERGEKAEQERRQNLLAEIAAAKVRRYHWILIVF
ncbi:hypothetical protein BJ912DRAFT_177942 [Pholiota molesta]|nr:hypothetical protein BJ912DRAFT_177942 [Pholiota molesta]